MIAPRHVRIVEERESRGAAGKIGCGVAKRPGLGIGGWVGMGRKEGQEEHVDDQLEKEDLDSRKETLQKDEVLLPTIGAKQSTIVVSGTAADTTLPTEQKCFEPQLNPALFAHQTQAWKSHGKGRTLPAPTLPNIITVTKPIPPSNQLPIYHHNLPTPPPEPTAPPQRSEPAPKTQRLVPLHQSTEPYPSKWPPVVPPPEVQEAEKAIMNERGELLTSDLVQHTRPASPRTGPKSRTTWRGPDIDTIPDSVPIPPITIQARVTIPRAKSTIRKKNEFGPSKVLPQTTPRITELHYDRKLIKSCYQIDYGLDDDVENDASTEKVVTIPRWCLPPERHVMLHTGAGMNND